MAQRTTLAPPSLQPSIALAMTLLTRLATLFGGLRGGARVSVAPDPAPHEPGEDPLALLRPLLAEFIERGESQAPFTTLLRRVQTLRGAGITTTVVVLTVSDAEADVVAALCAGADGYLLKDMEPEVLLAKLREAGAARWWSPKR